MLCRVYEGPSCAVCLGDYEDGEMIRQLPECHHHFHLDCIDQWLSTHTTCPMCRCSLLPPSLEPPPPQSPSVDRSQTHLLPLWASSATTAVQQNGSEIALELRPVSFCSQAFCIARHKCMYVRSCAHIHVLVSRPLHVTDGYQQADVQQNDA